MEKRRVVVTGLGVVSPVGSSVETAWAALSAGVNGIGPITRFDTTDYKAKLGAEVKDYDPMQYMERSECLRSDLFVRYAMGSAVQAVEESGVVGTRPRADQRILRFGDRRADSTFPDGDPPDRAPTGCLLLRAHDDRQHGGGGHRHPLLTEGAAMLAAPPALGANAIGEALRLIRHGYADAVVTGGTEASIVPLGVAGSRT